MEPCYQNSRLHPRTGGERWRRRERAQRGHRATAIARERFSSMRGTRIEVDFRTCSVSRDDLWPVDSSCARSPVLCERFKWEINIKRPFTTPSNKQLDSSFWRSAIPSRFSTWPANGAPPLGEMCFAGIFRTRFRRYF